MRRVTHIHLFTAQNRYSRRVVFALFPYRISPNDAMDNDSTRELSIDAQMSSATAVEAKQSVDAEAEPKLTTEALGMKQLLQGTLITRENLDRMHVSTSQLFGALVRQLLQLGYGTSVNELLRGVTAKEDLELVPWSMFMKTRQHKGVPATLQPYTDGCLDLINETRLSVCIRSGNMDAAMNFLTSPFGAFGCGHLSQCGDTALMQALRERQAPLCMNMLERFGTQVCKTQQVNKDGETALMMACESNMETVALKLMEYGAEACGALHVDKWGWTALLRACRRGLESVVVRILEISEGRGVEQVHRGTTAFQIACQFGQTNVALKMMEMIPEGLNVGRVYPNGNTALLSACRKNMEPVALRLVQWGAEACNAQKIGSNGDTALLWACRNNMVEVALALLDMGAEACSAPHANDKGHTALILACKRKMESVAMKLIKMGRQACNSYHACEDGGTALFVACENNMASVALALLSMGREECHADYGDEQGCTALIHASRNNMNDVKRKLSDFGVPEMYPRDDWYY